MLSPKDFNHYDPKNGPDFVERAIVEYEKFQDETTKWQWLMTCTNHLNAYPHEQKEVEGVRSPVGAILGVYLSKCLDLPFAHAS